ncbi:MAG: 1,4-dihydroxy-2-naphthoate polyprenyltransferase [Ardenticatenaceae bacterium]
MQNHANSLKLPPGSSPPPSLLKVWLMASRPKTLTVAVVPVIVGTALAVQAGWFEPLAALAALFCSILIQIGTNFANDLFDWEKGADTEARLGPTRVTSAGLLSPNEVRNGMLAMFGLSALLGLYLIYLGGWPILAIGVASILSGIAYTGGPFPLGYNGLGDLFVFVFFGLIAVVGTYYVQALEVTSVAFVASVPIGAIATAILVVNNVRDVDTDRVVGKRTLAVLFGRNAGRAEYVLTMLVSYLTPFFLWLYFGTSPWVLLPLLTLPIAIRLTRIVNTRTDGPILNKALAGTAQLLLLYGILFAVGLAL